MKLLVAGSSEVDAGKTTFTAGLVERTGVRGFKPRAGNGFWYDHDDYRRAVETGRLYGKDAKKLAAASPGEVRPEAINPVHRLWMPVPGGGKGLLGREERAFLVDRITPPAGEDRYVVNGTVNVPEEAERGLPLDEATVVEALPELNDLMARSHGPALDALGERIESREAAIVESYSDIARPLSAFVPDAVAVVEPRRCRVYDGERYAKACDVASGSAHEGRLEERVGHVTDLLDPAASVTLPALAGEERADLGAVASAYGEAYEALLSTV
ncbi:ATPase [Natronomonas marina]|jgi:predicted P-loop ATPase/GTPase|uniref:ATPase n=1 Tax=Natronomonas marina TaxID=2961939 RepID=UPI0020C9B546|nr:ATPase [Natronomonas marina]